MYEDKTIEIFRKDQYETSTQESLKKTENSQVRKEMEKIRLLTLRLKECETENKILEKNLGLIKQLICREIGNNYLHVQDLMKQGTESVKKERIEDVFLLKNEVDELQSYLSQMEDSSESTKHFPTKEYINQKILAERKAFWRMELERRLANETVEKEISPILKEKNYLHDKLQSENKRLGELNEEIRLLRGKMESEIDMKEKSKSIANSYQIIENQLRKTLLERREIRQELIEVKVRNEGIKCELFALKDESEVLEDNIKNSNSLILSYMDKKKEIQKAIEDKKNFFQKNLDYYKLELDEFNNRYDEDVMIIDSVRKDKLERDQILTDLDVDITNGNFTVTKESDGKENTALSEIKSSNLNHPSRKINTKNDNSKEKIAVNEDDDVNDDVAYSKEKYEMFLDWIKYKCLLETTEHQKELLSFIMQGQQRQISELELQNSEIKKEIKKKTNQKNILLKKLSKSRKSHPKKKTDTSLKSKKEFEELRIKIKVQKESNTFLRSLFGALFEIRAKDFVQYKTFLINRKEFYFNTILDIYSITTGKNLEVNHEEGKDKYE